MGYDPNESRNKIGEWSSNASGHNAGGGNREVAKKIASDHITKINSPDWNLSPNESMFKIKKKIVAIVEHEKGSKDLRINWVGTLAEHDRVSRNDFEGKNSKLRKSKLGSRDVVNAIKAIHKHYPDVEKLVGHRLKSASNYDTREMSINLKKK